MESDNLRYSKYPGKGLGMGNTTRSFRMQVPTFCCKFFILIATKALSNELKSSTRWWKRFNMDLRHFSTFSYPDPPSSWSLNPFLHLLTNDEDHRIQFIAPTLNFHLDLLSNSFCPFLMIRKTCHVELIFNDISRRIKVSPELKTNYLCNYLIRSCLTCRRIFKL